VAAPYVKAAAADMKAYRDGRSFPFFVDPLHVTDTETDISQPKTTVRSRSDTPQPTSPRFARCSRTTLLAAKTVPARSISMVSMPTSGQCGSARYA
jgi:hypothetical protein